MTWATVIDDEPQDSDARPKSRQKFGRLSTVVESPVSSRGALTPTALYSTLDTQRHQHGQQYNDLYDLTDDEAEELPIRISVSLESSDESMSSRKRFPSIVIPSPSKWPTPPSHQPQKTGASPAPSLSPGFLSPNSIVSPTPESLARLAARNAAQRPSSSSAPSLDGSMTSEELSSLSCPSTPDVERRAGRDEDWSVPAQLHPQSLQTLECLAGDNNDSASQLFAIPVAEMQEVGEVRVNDEVDIIITPVDADDETMSFLSIPSPGGFFSALDPSTRHAWAVSPDEPTTSAAEDFYGVPWQRSPVEKNFHSQSKPPTPRGRYSPSALRFPPIIERNIYVADDENLTEGPPTARRVLPSPKGSVTGTVQTPRAIATPRTATIPEDKAEYDENYIQDLRSKSVVSLDRTTHWLQEQTTYIAKMLDSPADAEQRQRSASDPESVNSSDNASTIGHKSVRFTETSSVNSKPASEESTQEEKDSIFVRGFQHLNHHANGADAFVHRKTRNEALQLDRTCLFPSHVDQLEGKYEIPDTQRVAPFRPISHFGLDDDENSEEKAIIANAQKERKALEQIKPVSWNLEATKYLNGGGLLMSPTGKTFTRVPRGRVLDLGGQASCDWAWQVAIEHPSATVHTVYATEQQKIDSSIQGPENHKQKGVPNLWTLPYPNDYFHLVSARNLYQHLRTSRPAGQVADEYDLCLREALRVLKPGGYLEFALLDADLLNPGPRAQALSVEFCFNLKTRGYDPAPTKLWLPRLRKAGFGDVRRAWLVLPMTQPRADADDDAPFPSEEGEGNTADASYITGMVGSWAWERWMLKLHREMGKPEDRLLEGVRGTLEEGAVTGASWRYLSGWARKPKA